MARFECIEPMYNLVKRQAEVELFPLALSENIGVIVYSPLAAGLLSGKFSDGRPHPSGRIVERDLYAKRPSDPAYHAIAARFYHYAEAKGINPVTLAVSWAKTHPAVTVPIIGARNVGQLTASLDAADLDLTPEMRREISSLSVQPANATDRLEEIMDARFQLRH